MSLQSLYNTKVDVIRISKTSDSMGGYTETEVVLHNDLPCRINWKRGSEKIFFNKNTYLRDAKLYCDVVDITTEEKVQYNGETYEILDVSDVDELGRLLVLELKLIK